MVDGSINDLSFGSENGLYDGRREFVLDSHLASTAGVDKDAIADASTRFVNMIGTVFELKIVSVRINPYKNITQSVTLICICCMDIFERISLFFAI